mmetsp:Transcript_70483/g.222658  ORF Transcript_70483/g.222658 Transcript_70483/m.222658 type:complete len:232 (-) Transcript_70483:511-1206(-)
MRPTKRATALALLPRTWPERLSPGSSTSTSAAEPPRQRSPPEHVAQRWAETAPAALVHLPAGQARHQREAETFVQEPRWQREHAVDPGLLLKLPAEQGRQRPTRGVPGSGCARPARQSMQTDGCEAPHAELHFPGAQGTHAAADDLPSRPLHLPAGQSQQKDLCVCPGTPAHLPAGHSVQLLFEVAPACPPQRPAGQCSQRECENSPTLLLQRPAGHGAQVRLLTAADRLL